MAGALIATTFVETLEMALVDHNQHLDPRLQIRIRLSLHTGNVIDSDGEWARQSVFVASRLADSQVVKRVLAAAQDSPLALIVSGDWYDAVIRSGYVSPTGYQQVWVKEKDFAGAAWVKVPGLVHPPGLLPEDSRTGKYVIGSVGSGALVVQGDWAISHEELIGARLVGRDEHGTAQRGGGSAVARGGGHGGGYGGGYDGWVPPARPRYLVARCQERVAVGKPFSLLASINTAASPTSAALDPFDVPPEGQDVLLVMYAPGLQLLSDQQEIVHVPADGDSKPARFELRADTPGPAKVSITAWIGGTHLGELRVEITAERDRAPGPHREVAAEITTQPTTGAVSLVVRYDPRHKAYRFEFRDEDNPDEVHSNLAYDPGPVVEQLVAELDNLAKGRIDYSADQTRDYLVNAGARLWQGLIPRQLREQFWDRQDRIRQLTILADEDVVPWELLYPMDPGRDAGFLVEQFPVMRAIFGWRPGRTLRLRPTRFVLPEGSLPEAVAEIDTMRRLLDPGQAPSDVISALTPLTDLIGSGNFGLLHFACHNTYDPTGGSSIRLGNVQFSPTFLEVAVIKKALQRSAPTVFINACRSAGFAATYNRLDGWASKFLEAGAAAFIGSLWAVSDGASREFAEELYRRLQHGYTLGEAVMEARQAAASRHDDPTWLAYTVYGDPRATISRSP